MQKQNKELLRAKHFHPVTSIDLLYLLIKIYFTGTNNNTKSKNKMSSITTSLKTVNLPITRENQ